MSVVFRMHAAGSTPGGAAKTRPSIVFAEDHDAFARILRALLGAHCDIVAAVGDGQSLVDATRACRPDVIVTDIDMPVMTGLDAARTILREQPRARIVFVTAADDAAIIRYALDLGALGYVSKSDVTRELLEAIRAAIGGNPYISRRCWNVLGRSLHADKRWSDDTQ